MKRYWILGSITVIAVAVLWGISLKKPTKTVEVVALTPQTAVRTELCPAVVTDNAHLQVFVPERLANVAKAEQAVTVSGAGFANDCYDATLTSIAQEATVKNGKTGLLGVVSLNKTDSSIKKGLSATAYLTVDTFENALVVHESWLQNDDGEWSVLLVENKKAVRRPVTLLQPVDGGVTVTGISSGAHIIKNPHSVSENQSVKEHFSS